jgi:hypothetical protein
MTKPFRSPLGYYTPIVTTIPTIANPTAEVAVSFPNEEPDTEDDLTINVALTHGGIVVDLFVSDGEPVATLAQTYDEFVGTIHAFDSIYQFAEEIDPQRLKVAALSAALRLRRENEADDDPTMDDLLDAIDAMLSEMGR